MESQNKNKAAIYIRVSTEEQAVDGQSASAQEETLRKYCSAYDIEVYDVYRDLGISGKSLKDRLGLKKLIEDCFRKKFDLVLVWKISRLSRSLKDLLFIIDIFERSEVRFASCSEKFDTAAPLGRMTLQLLGSIAEFERNTIVENVRLGLSEFARKGGKASSVLGYNNTDKKLCINENEASIVKTIFKLFTEKRLSYSGIAEYLNSMEIRTKRGGKYRSSGISYIINNPVYIGINRHNIGTENEYSVKDAHPPIITGEQWNKARGIAGKSRKISHETEVNRFPFNIFCLKCSSDMKVFYTCSKRKKYKYYRCCRCSNYINVEKLKEAVCQRIFELFCDRAVNKKVFGIIKSNILNHEKESFVPAFVPVNTDSEIRLQLEALEKKAKNNDLKYDDILRMKPASFNQAAFILIKHIGVYKGEIKIVLYL